MNSATLLGLIVRDPELRYTPDTQIPISTTLLEFAENTKGSPASTIKLVAWGKMADSLQQYTEGMQVLVEGYLRMNTVENSEGYKEKRVEFNVSRIHSLAKAAKADKYSEENDDGSDEPYDYPS